MKQALALVLILCVSAPLRETRAADASKPNVIFILADDLGWADTTLYGHTKYHRTPNIERLAKRGMTFTRAYSASPLCSPTRASILTGLSPARTGITTPNCHLPQVVLQATPGQKAAPGNKSVGPTPVTRLNTSYFTLAEALNEAGYATGHFGKWHLGAEPYSPLQQGFDVDVPHHSGPGPAGSYVAPWKFKDFDHDPAVPDQHIEDRMAQEAVAFMEQHRAEPFFLNYWMFSVHAPFDAKRSLIEKYRATVDANDPQHCPTYAAMVHSMDDAIGTLLDTLDRLKLADNTLIVFYSDNGGNMYSDVDGAVPTSNAPLRGGKATVYEGGIRVPCIVSLPGTIAAGSRSDAVVQSSDFYPTLVELLDLKPQDGQTFDGISIVPALTGKPLPREAIFTYFPHDPPVPDWLPPSVVVHQGDWKLIRLFFQGENGAHRWQLFNLREDIGETRDLAMKEPDRVKKLDSLIEKFLAETHAVQPVRNPDFDPAKYHPESEGHGKPRTEPKPKPKANPQAAAPAPAAAPTPVDDKLHGWKARNCQATVKDDILRVTNLSDASFLGFAAGKHSGPSTVKLRIKASAGTSHVDWLPGGAQSQPQTIPFTLRGGDWQEITVEMPATGSLGIVRVYLPKQDQPVEIDWIELHSKTGDKSTRTDF